MIAEGRSSCGDERSRPQAEEDPTAAGVDYKDPVSRRNVIETQETPIYKGGGLWMTALSGGKTRWRPGFSLLLDPAWRGKSPSTCVQQRSPRELRPSTGSDQRFRR